MARTTKTTNKKTSKPAAKSATIKKGLTLKQTFARVNFKNFIIPGVIILVIILLGIFRNQFIVAIINGEQISRLELINELEKSDGQRVLQNLVTQKLIEQEAEKRGIEVSNEEIDAEIAKIEESIIEQGQNLDDLLAIQNFTREQLRDQVENQVILQKMVNSDEIAITDEEINQYIEQNQESFPEDTDMEELKAELQEQLKQQKINTEVQNLLARLQSEASINYLNQ